MALLIFLAVIMCVLFGVGLYMSLVSSGLIPGREEAKSDRPRTFGYSTDSGGVFPRVPHVRELPQGCLIALILASTVWFLAWGVILVIAFNFLRSAT